MTNEKHLDKLCVYMNDLINIILYYGNIDYNFRKSLEGVRNEISKIREDIDGQE